MDALTRNTSRARHAAARVIGIFFIGTAAWFAWTTLFAIINYGWREPMFDQWAEYGNFIDLPFPANVLQEVNGHRPILPNLVRVAELHWFAADQLLQLAAGALAAFLIVLLQAVSAWRERTLPWLARCALVMLAVLGILWLANARRLLHGSEALHGYLPTLFALIAALCCWRAGTQRSPIWLAAACCACICATFSFGLGLASFATIFALHALLRLPWRWLALPAAALALCIFLYMFALPGHSVGAQLTIEPLENLRLFAQWMASPWMNGWLYYADPVAQPGVDYGTPVGPAMNATGHWVRDALAAVGMPLSVLMAVIGGVGIVMFCVMALGALRRPAVQTRTDMLALGMGVFALASGAITVVSRTSYLHEYPGQIYADRYLLWPSLFWACLAMLLVIRASIRAPRIVRVLGLAFLVVLPVALSATQRTGAIWGAIVSRSGDANAAALRSGVYDRAHFPGLSLDASTEIDQVARLRRAHMAMFAERTWERVGTAWSGTLQTGDGWRVDAQWLQPVTDASSAQPVGHFEGWVRDGLAKLPRDGQLVILDDASTIVGTASFSFLGPPGVDVISYRVRRKRGFDGFVRDFDPTRTYRLVMIDPATSSGWLLATLTPAHPAGAHD